MTTQLRENLADYYASLDSFQVLNILFPSQYDDAIQLTYALIFFFFFFL